MINPEMHSGGGYRSSNEIESDIRRTRGRMDATLDELSERLTARSILNLVLDVWDSRSARRREEDHTTAESHIHIHSDVPKRSYAKTLAKTQAKKAFRGLSHQIQENPIPSLLIGAGLAWMLFAPEEDEREYVDISGRRYRVNPAEPSGTAGIAGGTSATAYEYEDVEYEEIETGPGIVDKAKEKLSEGKEAVAGAAETMKEKLSDLGESASSAAHRTADRIRGRARETYYRGRAQGRRLGDKMHSGYESGAEHLRSGYSAGAEHLRSGYDMSVERYENAVQEAPLAVGIGFAALGALVGLLLPHTRREDELLGERSDELMDTVKAKGKETFERGKVVAERVAEVALDEAQKQGLTPEAVGAKLSDLAGKAGEVARRAKEEAASAAEEQHLMPGQIKEDVSSSTGTMGSSTETTSSSTGSFGQGEFASGEQSVTMPPKSTSQGGGL